MDTLSRIPRSDRRIESVTSVRLRKKGDLPGLVGLTTYTIQEYRRKGGEISPDCRHLVTFYSGLLDQLSDDAVVGVMAHELAHAWLNEHVGPEASKQREEDADILAEMWGFGEQLAVLGNETEPV